MRFLERVTLLVKADAHGVMDQLEERSLLLKQHLREAELDLSRKRARIEAMDEEERRLADDARACEARVGALDRDVELALAEGKDELARFAVRRLLPRRETLRALRDRCGELAQRRGRLQQTLEVQEVELEELRCRVRARLAEAREREIGSPVVETPVADEEIELELLRRALARSGGDSCEGGR